jgi:hypothetical protein
MDKPVPGRDESRVTGTATDARRVLQVTPPRSRGFFDGGLEKLRCFDPALAQGIDVFGHTAIGDAIEPRRIDTRPPQILLQA